MMQSISKTICFVLFCLGWATYADADLIDFESLGTSNGEFFQFSSINTASNSVTFSSGLESALRIAEVGAPRAAFGAAAGGDTVSDLTNVGSFFAGDLGGTGSFDDDFFMVFSNGIIDLSLDFYDFDPGGLSTAVFTIYADAAMANPLDSQTVTSADAGDGSVFGFSLTAPTGQAILAASIVTGAGENGSGIDNISFTAIPEPGALILYPLGIFVAVKRRRS